MKLIAVLANKQPRNKSHTKFCEIKLTNVRLAILRHRHPLTFFLTLQPVIYHYIFSQPSSGCSLQSKTQVLDNICILRPAHFLLKLGKHSSKGD